jgi:peptidoglycan hydrolase-like protein with peptidoglycan-binding domain
MTQSRGGHSGSKGSLGMPALVIAGALVAGAAGAVAILASHQAPGRTPATLVSTKGSGASSHHGHHRVSPAPALAVAAISPKGKAAAASWRAPVTVRFTEPLATSSPLPALSPPVPGTWTRVGTRTLRFQPIAHYAPFSKETVIVPAGARSDRGVRLGRKVVASFTVEGASTLRLQELLAELGYLPVSFAPGPGASAAGGTLAHTTPPAGLTPAPPLPATTGTTVLAAPSAPATSDFEPSSPGDVPLRPLEGTFSWRFSHIPPTLAALWQAGQPNVVTTGAVMAFETANGLGADGVAGPLVWAALLRAAAAHQVTAAPYDYVYVTEHSPEYVTVWRDGVNVFTTLANTGIPQAPTQPGTWPVYARYTVTTMSGTNPDGTKYHDTGIPWVSYFHGGDALHGFLRTQYGFPQSLGCVEMPYGSAGVVYPYTPLGTLVTVE